MSSILESCTFDSSDGTVVEKLPQMFLICDYCFWSASAIKTRRHDVVTCPMCDKVISRLPLADKEIYLFRYDEKHGVELEFLSRR